MNSDLLRKAFFYLIFSAQLGITPQFLNAWNKPQTIIEDPALGPEAVCTATLLNLRDQPWAKGDEIGQIRKGEIVKVLKCEQTTPQGSDFGQTIDGITSYWFRIATKNGKEGYVFGGYLEDLFSAVRTNNTWAISKLLTSGVNINQERDSATPTCGAPHSKFTSLYVATELGNQETVEYLLKSGADPNKGRRYIDYYLPSNPEIIQSPLMVVASSGIARTLLERGANPNQKTAEGETPLSRAIENSRMDIASVLIAHGAELSLSLKDRFSELFSKENPALQKWLMEIGWDPNVEDSFGWTPLMHCVYHGQSQMAHFLRLRGSREDGVWKAEFLSLLRTGTAQDIQNQIDKIPSVNFDSPYGSPMGTIPMAGEEAVAVAKLLLGAGANPNGTARDKNPPLCRAVLYENKIAELLLDFGADATFPCHESDEGAENARDVLELTLSKNEGSNPTVLDKIFMARIRGPVQPSENKITEEHAWRELAPLLNGIKNVHSLIETRFFNDIPTIESTETFHYWRGGPGLERGEGNDGVFRFYRNSKEAWLFNKAGTQRAHWGHPTDAAISSPFPTLNGKNLSMGTLNPETPSIEGFQWIGLQRVGSEECFAFSAPAGYLWISRKDGLPRRMLYTASRMSAYPSAGELAKQQHSSKTQSLTVNTTRAELIFTNTQANLPLDEKEFAFEPKPGTWYQEIETGKPSKILTARPRVTPQEQARLRALFAEIDEKYHRLGSFSGNYKQTFQTPIEGFLTFSKPYKIYFKIKGQETPNAPFFMTDGYDTWRTRKLIPSDKGITRVYRSPLKNPKKYWEDIGDEPFREPEKDETYGIKGFVGSLIPSHGEEIKKTGDFFVPFFAFRPFFGMDRKNVVFMGEEVIQNTPVYRFLCYPENQGRIDINIEIWVDKNDGFMRKEITTISNIIQGMIELTDVKVNMNPPPEMFRWTPIAGYVLEGD